MNRAEYKYAGVKYDRKTGKIKGETNMGFGDEMYPFSASPNLLAVLLALSVVPQSITLEEVVRSVAFEKFMNLADGFGEPGSFPGGYDWSGIRDSTPESKEMMFALAKNLLAPYKKHLRAMGLPATLVADITEVAVNDDPIGMFDEVVVTPESKKAN